MTYAETMIKKYGSREAWLAHQREMGATGGKAKVPKGFAKMDKSRLKEVTRKGGRNKK